jgi:cytidine deaminase
MTDEWKKLYECAKSVVRPHKLSEQVCVGSVGAAVLSANGNIYTGVCVDTDCGMGFCAERNAISTMFTCGEYEIAKVCAVYKDGGVMLPCGVCREFMMQMGENAENIEVLAGNDGSTVLLKELLPDRCVDNL